MNEGLSLRGAQMHGQRYIPMLLERMASRQLVTEQAKTPIASRTAVGRSAWSRICCFSWSYANTGPALH
jgi:hypothetical protein